MTQPNQPSEQDRSYLLADARAELERLNAYMDHTRKARVAVGWCTLGATLLLSVAVVAVGFPEHEEGQRYWDLGLQAGIVITSGVLAGLIKAWSDLGHVLQDMMRGRNECASEVSVLRVYAMPSDQEIDFATHTK